METTSCSAPPRAAGLTSPAAADLDPLPRPPRLCSAAAFSVARLARLLLERPALSPASPAAAAAAAPPCRVSRLSLSTLTKPAPAAVTSMPAVGLYRAPAPAACACCAAARLAELGLAGWEWVWLKGPAAAAKLSLQQAEPSVTSSAAIWCSRTDSSRTAKVVSCIYTRKGGCCIQHNA